ncbi:hypothetical protein J6590_030363 [Homalodisca vitripennis]|nr:hypothetical protein J6590_030363 [Homalodisca vitripennis]
MSSKFPEAQLCSPTKLCSIRPPSFNLFSYHTVDPTQDDIMSSKFPEAQLCSPTKLCSIRPPSFNLFSYHTVDPTQDDIMSSKFPEAQLCSPTTLDTEIRVLWHADPALSAELRALGLEYIEYAETAMNELLGWYGYGKVDSRDTQGLKLQHFASSNRTMGHGSPPSPSDSSSDGEGDGEGLRVSPHCSPSSSPPPVKSWNLESCSSEEIRKLTTGSKRTLYIASTSETLY